MKLNKQEEEMSFTLNKILLVELLAKLVKSINGYKIIQINDFEETWKNLSKWKIKKLGKNMS